MDPALSVQMQDEAICISHNVNIHWERYESNYSLDMGK